MEQKKIEVEEALERFGVVLKLYIRQFYLIVGNGDPTMQLGELDEEQIEDALAFIQDYPHMIKEAVDGLQELMGA